jgi:hypothetical protein
MVYLAAWFLACPFGTAGGRESCSFSRAVVPDTGANGLDLPVLIWKLEQLTGPEVTALDSFYLFDVKRGGDSAESFEVRGFSMKDVAQASLVSQLAGDFSAELERTGQGNFELLKKGGAGLSAEGKLFLLSVLSQRVAEIYPESSIQAQGEMRDLLISAARSLGFLRVESGPHGRVHFQVAENSGLLVLDHTSVIQTHETDPARAHELVQVLLKSGAETNPYLFRVYRPRSASWAERVRSASGRNSLAEPDVNYQIQVERKLRTVKSFVGKPAEASIICSELGPDATLTAVDRYHEKAQALVKQINPALKLENALDPLKSIAGDSKGVLKMEEDGKIKIESGTGKPYLATRLDSEGVSGAVGVKIQKDLGKSAADLTVERSMTLSSQDRSPLKFETAADQVSLIFDTRGREDGAGHGRSRAYALYEGNVYLVGGMENLSERDIVHRFKVGIPHDKLGQIYTVASMEQVRKSEDEKKSSQADYGIGMGLEKKIGETVMKLEFLQSDKGSRSDSQPDTGRGLSGSFVVNTRF